MGFLSNHDMDRIAGAFILENNMKMAANLYLLAPGSPVIYYGEEIGMRGSRGGEMTDANRRLAMLWGDDDLIRNPEGSTYPADKQISTTVVDQLADENSLLRYYCKLLTLRHKYPAIARGTYTSLSTGEKNLGGFVIEYIGSTLLLLHNNGSEPISYDLNQYGISTLCDYIGMGDASLEGTVLTLGPQTSAIIQ
jgi:glycosidase